MSHFDTFVPLRLPAAQAQTVKRLAAEANTSTSDIVRRAIGLLVSAQLSQPKTEAKHDHA